jgi:hypothetical protein
LKRKADALKATKSKSEKKGDSGTKYGTATAIKRYVPSKHLSKDDQKNEALQVALQDAQSRGLPEGWSCFYGVSHIMIFIIETTSRTHSSICAH